MKNILLLIVLALCLNTQSASAQMLSKGVSKELAEYRKANISKIVYDLSFEIPANIRQHVEGKVIISFNLKAPQDVILDFLGDFDGNCYAHIEKKKGKTKRIPFKASYRDEHIILPMEAMQEGINKVIRLRDRLNDRINANAETVGSDEVFFEGNKQNLEDIFNEKAGVLDEEDDGEVDLASQAFQIWESATKDNPALKERIQGLADVVYSTKPAGEYPPGVITYARTRSDSDVLVWLNADGGVASQSVGKIFAALACGAATPKLPPLENHHDLVTKAVASVKNVQSAAVGVLGSRSSTKYRIFTILQNRLKEDVLPLFEQNLKAAADQVYTYPMKETARNALGKMLQKRLPVDDIIQTVLEFHKDNELCIVPEDEDVSPLAARIICSMGMKSC